MTQLSIIEELEYRLEAMRRRWKRIQFVRGLVRTLALGAAVVTIGCAVDYVIELNLLFRCLLTGTIYLTIGSYAYWAWLRPMFTPTGFDEIAWKLERSCPELNEKLISAVTLDDEDAEAVSLEMIANVLAEANYDLGQITPAQAFPMSWRNYRVPLSVIAAFAVAMCIPALQLRNLVSRTTLPSRRDAGVGSFRLVLTGPQKLEFIEGESVTFTIKPSRKGIPRVSLFLKNVEAHIQRVDMSFDKTVGAYVYTLDNIYDDLEFWAKSGKVSTRVVDLDVVKRPKIDYFEITSTPPAYTGITTRTIKATAGDLRVLENTHIDLVIHSSKPLSAAELVIGKKTIAMGLDGTRKRARCSFQVTESANYQVFMRDLNGLGNPGTLTYDITAITDEQPKVVLRDPTHDLYLNSDDMVRLEWFVNDDYGIAHQELRYQVNAQPFQGVTMPVGASVFHLFLSQMKLEPGDQVELVFRVRDEAGQSIETLPRRITVITGRGLRGANQFVAYVEQAREQLAKAQRLLADIRATLDDVQSGHNGNAPLTADLGHSANMLTHRVNELDRQMLLIQHTCGSVRDHGFFPMSHAPPELLRLALQHDRIFLLQNLLDAGPTADAADRLKLRFELCDKLLADLGRRSRYVIIDAVGENLLRTLEQIADQEAGTPSRTRLRIRAQKTASNLIRMSGLKTAATKEIQAIDPAKDPDGKSLKNAFLAFRKESKKRDTDHRQAARQLSRLGRELPLLQTEFAGIIRNLDLYDSAHDWQVVRSIARDFRSRPSPLADQLADNRLLADVLAAGIKKKSLKHLRRVNLAMPPIRSYHDLIRFEPFLEGFAERLNRDDLQLRDLSADADLQQKRLKRLAKRIATEQSWQVEILLGFPFRNHTLESHAPLRAIVRQLNAAQGHFTSFSNLAASGDFPKARLYFTQAIASARYAQRLLQTQIARSYDARELARKALEKMVLPRSQQLIDITRAIGELADTENDLTVNDQRQIDALQMALNRASRNLEQEALGEIAQSSGDVRAAMSKLVVAIELDSLRRVQMQNARDALSAIEVDLLREEEDDPLHPARGEEWQQEQLDLAREQLQAAADQATATVQLLQQVEEAKRGELSRGARRQHHGDVEILARVHMTKDLLENLISLQRIRDSRTRTDQLAETIRSLRANRSYDSLARLRRNADVLSADVRAAMDSWDAGRFRHLAQDQLTQTRAALAALLQEVRNLRRNLRTELKPEVREKHIIRLPDQPLALEKELLRTEGFRRLLGWKDREATVLFRREVLPPIDRAVQILRKNQSPGADADRAVNGLKRLERLLDNYALEIAGATPEKKAIQPIPKAEAPLRSRLEAELDRLKHQLTAAEIAARSMESLRKKLTDEQNSARKLLDSLPLEKLDANRRKIIARHRRLFEKVSPKLQALAIRSMTPLLDEKTMPVAALKQRAAALNALQPSYERVLALARVTARVAVNGTAATQRILRYFDQLENTDLANSSRRLANHLQDNLKLADFRAAQANLYALTDNIAEIPLRVTTNLPLPIPPERAAEAWQIPIPAAKLTEMDWNARRALLLILASRRTPAVIVPLLAGNYSLAAVATDDLQARSDLRIAAARRKRIGSRRSPTKVPARFRFPDGVMEQQASLVLRREAKEQPARFLNDLDTGVARARTRLISVKEAIASKKRGQLLKELGALAKEVAAVESRREILGSEDHPAHAAVIAAQHAAAKPSPAMDKALDRALKRLEAALASFTRANALRRALLLRQLRIEEMSRRFILLAQSAAGKQTRDGDPDKAKRSERAAGLLQSVVNPLAAALGEDYRPSAPTAIDTLADIMRRTTKGDYDVAGRGHGLMTYTRATPIPVPPLALRGEAFQASATADLLANYEAIMRAKQGYLAGAAASMRDLADKSPDGIRGLCEAAAARYESAEQQAEDDLPDELLEVMEQSAAVRSVESDPVARLLRQFENRAKQGDFERAANCLMPAVAAVSGRTKQMMTDWRTSLQRAADVQRKRLETVTDENRIIVAELREWERTPDEAVRSELDWAISHVLDGDTAAGAQGLRQAAEGLPERRGNQLRRLAYRLDHPAPRLGLGDLAQLDWNARLGVMKAMADGSRESKSATREALRGNYDQAAALAQGTAQSEFAVAAKLLKEKREDRAAIAAVFARPRIPLDLLSMERLRRQLTADRPYFLARTAAELQAARKQIQTAFDHLNRKKVRDAINIVLKLKEPLARIEARRHLLGESNHFLDSLRAKVQQPTSTNRRKRPDGKAARKHTEALDAALVRLAAELQAEITAAARETELMWLLDDLSAKVAIASVTPKTLADMQSAAGRLQARLKKNGGVLDLSAAKRVAAVLDSMKRRNLIAALALMRDVHRAVNMLDTQRPRSVAMIREAYEAASMAAVVGNRNALDHARAGNYEAAATSMLDLAKSLPAGALADLAFRSSDRFREAAEAQYEGVRNDLVQTIRHIPKVVAKLPPAAAKGLADAGLAVRNGGLNRAVGHLRVAVQLSGGRERVFLQNFDRQLQQVQQAAVERERGLPPVARDGLITIRELTTLAAGLPAGQAEAPLAEIARAEAMVLKSDYAQASTHLRNAAEALAPLPRRLARVTATRLSALDWDVYGAMSRPARDAVRHLSKPWPKIMIAARQQNYELAATHAQQVKEGIPSALFKEAARQAAQSPTWHSLEAAAALNQAIRLSSGALQLQCRNAVAYLAAGMTERAYHSTRRAIRKSGPQITLAGLLARAHEYELTHHAPLIAAAELAAANRFGEAAVAAANAGEDGAALSNRLSDFERSVDSAIWRTLELAMTETNTALREELETIAERTIADDLSRAAEIVMLLEGTIDEQLAEDITDANQLRGELAAALLQAAEDSQARNRSAFTAQKLVKKRQGALAGSIFEAQAEAAQHATALDDVDLAKLSIEEFDYGDAADTLANIRLGAAAAKLFEQAAEQMADGQEAALGAAGQSTDEKEKRALLDTADAYDPADAARLALAAGTAGTEARALFLEAGDSVKQAMAALEQTTKSIAAAQARAKARANQMTKKKEELAKLNNLLKNGELGEAAAFANSLAKGSYQASLAVSLMAKAIARPLPKKVDEQVMPPALGPQRQFRQRVEENLARAMADLQNARDVQSPGVNVSHARQAIERVSTELSSAAWRLARSAADQARNLMTESSGQVPLASVDPVLADASSTPWTRPDLGGGSATSRDRYNRYTPYYRKLNQRYLEWVARESRKWQSAEEDDQ